MSQNSRSYTLKKNVYFQIEEDIVSHSQSQLNQYTSTAQGLN